MGSEHVKLTYKHNNFFLSAYLENYYDDLSQQQMMFESGLDLTNTTETQKYPNYYIP